MEREVIVYWFKLQESWDKEDPGKDVDVSQFPDKAQALEFINSKKRQDSEFIFRCWEECLPLAMECDSKSVLEYVYR